MVIFIGLALTSVGCMPGLKPIAAQSLGCAVDKVEVDTIGLATSAKGCNREDIYLYDVNQRKWLSLLDRAALEFSCDRSKLSVSMLDSIMFSVEGCDRRAIFVTVPTKGFVMDTHKRPNGGPPPIESETSSDDSYSTESDTSDDE